MDDSPELVTSAQRNERVASYLRTLDLRSGTPASEALNVVAPFANLLARVSSSGRGFQALELPDDTGGGVDVQPFLSALSQAAPALGSAFVSLHNDSGTGSYGVLGLGPHELGFPRGNPDRIPVLPGVKDFATALAQATTDKDPQTYTAIRDLLGITTGISDELVSSVMEVFARKAPQQTEAVTAQADSAEQSVAMDRIGIRHNPQKPSRSP